jgi:hypothetical protein
MNPKIFGGKNGNNRTRISAELTLEQHAAW